MMRYSRQHRNTLLVPWRRHRLFGWLAPLLLVLNACALQPGQAPAPPEAQIRALLDAQQLAWNRGDLEDFMQGYWHDDALRFDSGSTTMLGWQATHDRYVARYPDRRAMGRLTFADLSVHLIDEQHAEVTGSWALERAAADRPHGKFVLSLRHIKDNWKIVQDRTEVAPPDTAQQ